MEKKYEFRIFESRICDFEDVGDDEGYLFICPPKKGLKLRGNVMKPPTIFWNFDISTKVNDKRTNEFYENV